MWVCACARYESILADVEAQLKAHAEACFATNTAAELIKLYDGAWRPKLNGASTLFAVQMFLLQGVREEGAVLIAAYDRSTKRRCEVIFVDAKGALSLTSPMELREAQKLKQKTAGVGAKRASTARAAAPKKLHGLKDAAKMTLARLELQKQTERECLASVLLMRFVLNKGMLTCRLLKGDFKDQKKEDVCFILDENPGFPEPHIEELFASVEQEEEEAEDEPEVSSSGDGGPSSAIITGPAEIAAE